MEILQRFGDIIGNTGVSAKQKVGVAFRRARADARQVSERLDDA